VTCPVAASPRTSLRKGPRDLSVRGAVRAAALGAVLGLVPLALAVLGAGEARANEQRRNTPSVGIQYGYGAVNGTGEMNFKAAFPATGTVNRHEDFRWGGALSLHIRYSLDQSHALGVSFEDLRFHRKNGLADPTLKIAKQYQVNNAFIDYYVYFDRRARVTPYLLLGVGFHKDTFRFSKYDNLLPPIALSANLGLGMEYFVRPTWSIDTTVRGYWIGQRGSNDWSARGSAPLAASLQLGLQYYLVK
jgi:hypothetical protein